MKRSLIAAFVLFGANQLHALGTDAGEVITNEATLSYSAGGVPQPDVKTTDVGNSGDSFVVDKKIDMILETDDSDQIEVTPGQTGMITTYTFKNEGNSEENFKFDVKDLGNGAEADYDGDKDNEDTTAMVIEYSTDGGSTWTALPADGIVTVPEDGEVNVRVKADIPAATTGADGDIMNVELTATAYDEKGAPEVEDTGSDKQDEVDIVFADGESVLNGATTTGGQLGSKDADDKINGHDNYDTPGDGMDVARSGYIIQTPVLNVEKTSCVISDPVNNTTNPKRIPGAIIRYMFDIKNTGTGDVSDLDITDTINGDLDLTGTKDSAKKKENQSSCTCADNGDDISGDTTVTGQDLKIEKINVDHGAVQGTPGENHTCVTVDTEIK